MSSALQMPNAAQMLREVNPSKKQSLKSKPGNVVKTISCATAGNAAAGLQHSKSNQLGSATASNIKGIGQCTSLNATLKQTSNQAQRNSEKLTQEMLHKKHSNLQIKVEGLNSTSTGGAAFGQSPKQAGKTAAVASGSAKASQYATGPTPSTAVVSSAKSSKAMISVQARLSAQTTKPKGQKQAARLQKMQKNQHVD